MAFARLRRRSRAAGYIRETGIWPPNRRSNRGTRRLSVDARRARLQRNLSVVRDCLRPVPGAALLKSREKHVKMHDERASRRGQRSDHAMRVRLMTLGVVAVAVLGVAGSV